MVWSVTFFSHLDQEDRGLNHGVAKIFLSYFSHGTYCCESLIFLTGYKVLGIVYLNQVSGAPYTQISYHDTLIFGLRKINVVPDGTTIT